MVFEVCFGSRYKLRYNWQSSHSNLQKMKLAENLRLCGHPESGISTSAFMFFFGGMNDTMPPPVSVYFHSAQSLCIKNEANCHPYLINM